jgi:hypothetical protein
VATNWRGDVRSCHGLGRQEVPIRDRRRSASLADSSEGAPNFSSTTSCSGPTTRRGVRRAGIADGTASWFTWRTTQCLRRVVASTAREVQAFKRRMGWTFRASSFSNTSFASTSRLPRATAQGSIEYNFERSRLDALDATRVGVSPSPRRCAV